MSKKELINKIIEEYGVTSVTDITNALKDLLGDTLKEMMNVEFDEHLEDYLIYTKIFTGSILY